MTASYKLVGNICNIPDYHQWSSQSIGTNTIANAPESLANAKLAGRKKVADLYEKQYGYKNSIYVGGDPEDFLKWEITNSTVIDNIAKLIGYNKPSGRVQVQLPGSMVPLHLDNLKFGYIDGTDQVVQKNEFTQDEIKQFNNNPTVASRVLIFLDDWYHGQGVMFNDQYFDKWQRGDVVTWNWIDGIHATVNAGFWARPLLRLSGLVTKKWTNFKDSSVPFSLNYC